MSFFSFKKFIVLVGLVGIIFTSVFFIISPAKAAVCGSGLVPCGRNCDVTSTTDIDESKPCQLCHLFVLIDRLIDFLLINILFPIAVLMLVIAGILYVGAVFEILPGGFKTLSQAKGIILSVILGLIVIFAAFILIGLFFRQIDMADWTTNIYKNWWSQGFFQIKCQIK